MNNNATGGKRSRLQKAAGCALPVAMKWVRILWAMAAASMLVVPGEVQARDSLGVFESWGAFRDAAGPRCYAVAEPVRRGRGAGWHAFASIATWPRQSLRNQLHMRLSQPRRVGSRVTLSIGEQRFPLVAGRADAWAPDKRVDAAIVAAMRSGTSMSVETVAESGRGFADVYALRGAATAIDAAALGCSRR